MSDECGASLLVLRDTPVRLVFKVIVLSLACSLLYLVVALMSNLFPRFDHDQLWGIVPYDVATFLALVLVQQCITLLWLLRWFTRSYSFGRGELRVREGVLFAKNTTIPLRSIKSVTQHQDWIGRTFNYSTIVIALINEPHAVVIPYMTNPQQVMNLLEG